MINKCMSMDSIPDVITPIYKLSKNNIHNPAVVKTLISNNDKIIYFSRSALPHIREAAIEDWHKHTDYWGHVGIYGYRADVLKKWFTYPFSKLEQLEKLEQLKLIEAGCIFDTFKIKGTLYQLILLNNLRKQDLMLRNYLKMPKLFFNFKEINIIALSSYASQLGFILARDSIQKKIKDLTIIKKKYI